MAYRRTENVVRRLAARHDAIVAAAARTAGDGGMASVQIAPVARQAGIAAGTVYRYFPGKSGLVGALIADVCERELAAMRRAADAAPGPLSALAAALTTFAARAQRDRRLIWAVMAEPVEPDIEMLRREYRRAFADEIAARISEAVAGSHLPDQDAALVAPAVAAALIEGICGPLAPASVEIAERARDTIQALTLNALRGLGVVDARARGLVVQTAFPAGTG